MQLIEEPHRKDLVMDKPADAEREIAIQVMASPAVLVQLQQMNAFITTFLSNLNKPEAIPAEQFCLDLFHKKALSMVERPMKAIIAENLKLWSARVNASNTQHEGLNCAGTSAPETPDT